mgnify:FL=1
MNKINIKFNDVTVKEFYSKFNDVTDVSKFVHILSKYDADFNLYCGSYCVDAKSLLGIMTMDLRNSMWMTGNCEPNEASQIIRELGDVVAA